jgi:hypothetical protein
MRRPVIKLLVPVALVLALFAYCLNERHSGQASLRSIQRELTEAGLLRSLSELTPQAPPEALENGRQLLREIEGFKDLRKTSAAVREGPELMNYIAPGIAEPITRKATPPYLDGTKGAAESWEELWKQFQRGSHIVAQAERLLSEPIALEYDYSFPGTPLRTNEMQDLMVWLRAAAVIKLRGGDTAAAINHLQSAVRTSKPIFEIGTLVFRVLGMGMLGFGTHDLCWEILQAESLNDTDLARLQEIMVGHNFVDAAQEALLVEASLVPSNYSWLERNLSTFAKFESLQGRGPLGSSLGIAIRNLLWPILWAEMDQARALSRFVDDFRLGKELIDHRNAQVLAGKNALDEIPVYTLWRYPLASAFPEGSHRALWLAAVRFETRRQMILAAIALKRHQLAHNGVYPESLEELVPAYLAAQPHDWFDGKPLKYKRLEDGTFLLYSVGRDGIDHGGDVIPIEPAQLLEMDSGRDLVWPRPAENHQR